MRSINQQQKDSMRGINQQQKEWLKKENVFPKEIIFRDRKYTILDRNSEGYVDLKGRIGAEGFVLKVENEFKAKYALKVNPGPYYTKDKAQNEVELSSNLQSYDAFVIPSDYDFIVINEIHPTFEDKEYCCFMSKWIDGNTLKNIINHKPEKINLNNTVEYLVALIDVIACLKDTNLEHDDLHLGNIMIVNQGSSIDTQEVLKIIDTGNLRENNQVRNKYNNRREDFYNFAFAVCALRDALYLQRNCYIANLDFFNKLDELISKLNDDDEIRALGADIITNDVNQAIRDMILALPTRNLQKVDNLVLTHPFDALSAEYISSNHLLLDLFIQYEEVYRDLIGLTPVLMYGPRGCGKSMAFRYAAVNTHLNDDEKLSDVFKAIPYLGIYIPCANWASYLSWISKEEFSNDKTYYIHALTTFFSLELVIELSKTLKNIQSSESALKHYICDLDYEESLERTNNLADQMFSYTKEFFSEEFLTFNNIAKTSKFSWLENFFLGLKGKINYALLHNKKLPFILPHYYILKIGKMLYSTINESHKIVYLLDDYSYNKVPKISQSIFNITIWDRNDYQHFNISSEKDSFYRTDYNGVSYEDNREFVEVDVGLLILKDKKDNKNDVNFISGVVNQRLKNAKWDTSIDKLVGDNKKYKTHKALAIAIKDNPIGGTFYCYYGIDIISSLWSGDISVILQLFNRMTKKFNQNTSDKEILPSDQHNEIRILSQTYSDNIKNYRKFGKEMANIVDNFGEYAHWKLKNTPLEKNGIKVPPYIVSRLEYTVANSIDYWDQLKKYNLEAHAIGRELIKKTIFIELPKGRAKDGVSSVIIWRLKKIYYPIHYMSFGKTQHLNINNIQDFVDFLTKTKIFLDKKKKTPDEQQSIVFKDNNR